MQQPRRRLPSFCQHPIERPQRKPPRLCEIQNLCRLQICRNAQAVPSYVHGLVHVRSRAPQPCRIHFLLRRGQQFVHLFLGQIHPLRDLFH